MYGLMFLNCVCVRIFWYRLQTTMVQWCIVFIYTHTCYLTLERRWMHHLNSPNSQGGEMAQRLRALALAEDGVWFPASIWQLTTIYNYSFRGSDILFWLASKGTWYVYVVDRNLCKQNTHTHNSIILVMVLNKINDSKISFIIKSKNYCFGTIKTKLILFRLENWYQYCKKKNLPSFFWYIVKA